MSDIIKSLKNIKEQLNQLVHEEEQKSSTNVQPEKLITSPLITCQKVLFRDNNISNQANIIEELMKKNKVLAAESRKFKKKCTAYRKSIRELKSVNRNQRFVFMNKLEDLENVNRYLKDDLFKSREKNLEIRDDLNEMSALKEQYAEECRFYKKEFRANLKISQLRFTPNEHNGEMINHHTTFNPQKATCFICTDEKYSYTRVCCGMGICFNCLYDNYQKKLDRMVDGNRLIIGYDCPACGARVSNSPEALDPSLREIINPPEWDNEGEGW